MFDLEQAIAEWRRQMLAAGIKTPVPLDELESHLREDLEREIRAGSSARQAFASAVQRLGQPRALEAEFAKTAELTETRERRRKLRCIVFAAVAYLAPFAPSVPQPWSRMSPAEQWLGLAAVALTVVSMFGGLFLHRFLPVIPAQRSRTRVQFACVLPVLVWPCVYTFVVLPRVELTVAQMSVATLWAIFPLAVVWGLAYGLDEAARRGTSALRS